MFAYTSTILHQPDKNVLEVCWARFIYLCKNCGLKYIWKLRLILCTCVFTSHVGFLEVALLMRTNVS